MRYPLISILVALAASAGTLPAQSIRVSVPVDELEARARADSLDAAAQYNLALGYMSRRAWARADTALAAATTLDPQFAPAWLARAVVWDRDDRYWESLRRTGGEEAVRAELRQRASFHRRAFLVDPFVDIRVIGGMMRLGGTVYDGLALMYGQDFNRLAAGYRSGLRALVEGDYDLAFSGFNQAMVILNSQHIRGTGMPPDILFLHVLAGAGSNHLPEAIASASTLLTLTLDEERADTSRVAPLRTNEYRYILAALHQRAGNTDSAMALYHQVAAADIGNYMAHSQLARIHEAAQRWDAAVTERRAAVDADNENHVLYLELGTVLARTGRYAEAEAALEQARAINPRDPRVYYRIGVVLQALGRRPEATAAFEHFIAVAPSRFAPAVADARSRLTQLASS